VVPVKSLLMVLEHPFARYNDCAASIQLSSGPSPCSLVVVVVMVMMMIVIAVMMMVARTIQQSLIVSMPSFKLV